MSTLGQPLAGELRRQSDWGGAENSKVAFLRRGGSGNWGGGDLKFALHTVTFQNSSEPPLAGRPNNGTNKGRCADRSRFSHQELVAVCVRVGLGFAHALEMLQEELLRTPADVGVVAALLILIEPPHAHHTISRAEEGDRAHHVESAHWLLDKWGRGGK